MIKGLEAFSHGQIQDALNIIKIMEAQSLTKDDLKDYVRELVRVPRVRRLSRKERERMVKNTRWGRKRK